MTPPQAAEALDQTLRSLGNADRAEQEKRYLRSDLTHYGGSVPKIRAAAVATSAAYAPTRADLFALVENLWSRGVHDCRMAAVELLRCNVKTLTPADLEAVERLLREARTWAIVDGLAVEVAGRLYEREPAAVEMWLDRWATDDDFWLRRSALLALLPTARRGHLEVFLRYADPMLSEREFFIRKAIGWVLREGGKKRPDEVAAWVRQRLDRLSGVTIREAVKRLPEAEREALLAAYRALPG